MPDKTYTKVVPTTSMSVSDRRKLKEWEKILKAGGTLPPEEPERQPRRAGLHSNMKYTYTVEGPQIIDRTKRKEKAQQIAQAQVQIVVPHLKGQEDIPKSDSPEPEDHYRSYLNRPLTTDPHTQAPLATTSADRANDPDDAGSQASTEIEDGEGSASERGVDDEDEEGEEGEEKMEAEGPGMPEDLEPTNEPGDTGDANTALPQGGEHGSYGVPPPFTIPVVTPFPFPGAGFPDPATGFSQAFHVFGAHMGPMALDLADISFEEQALLMNAHFLPSNDTFNTGFSGTAGHTTAPDLYTNSTPDYWPAPHGPEPVAPMGFTSGTVFTMPSPAPCPTPDAAPGPGPAPTPSPGPGSQPAPSNPLSPVHPHPAPRPEQPSLGLSGHLRASIPPRSSIPTVGAPCRPQAPINLPRPILATVSRAGSPFPSSLLRTPSAPTSRTRASTPFRPPSSATRPHAPTPLRAATLYTSLIGPSYRLPTNAAAVGTPARGRSASPRPPAYNAPLARSLQPQPPVRTTRALTPAIRLGTPFPSTPRPEMDPISSPRTPVISTPPTRNQATTSGSNRNQLGLENEAAHEELDWDTASHSGVTVTPSPRVLRVRTPPPLARESGSIIMQDAAEDSDQFVDNGSRACPIRYKPNAGPARAAPTTAEFAMTQAQEILALQNIRKTKPNLEAGRTKGAKKITAYMGDEPKLMAVMKASMQHSFTTLGPWIIPDPTLYTLAKDFAKAYTNFPVDTLADDEVIQSLKIKASQTRAAPLDPVKELVQEEFDILAGDEQTVNRLQWGGHYLYPGYSMEHADQFNTTLMAKVVVTLYFYSGRRLGIIYMDELLKEDDPTVLTELISKVALPSEQGTPQVLEILDRSPEALRGPSLAAIAFAAINIHHALERLKIRPELKAESKGKKKSKDGKTKVEFNEGAYNDMWKQYVRELATHPRLGQIRSAFLDKLKEEYCNKIQRFRKPIGSDHMW